MTLSALGAVIAGCYARGLDAAAVDAEAYEYFVRVNPLGDYTVPTKGLIRGRRAEGLLERSTGGVLIEELPGSSAA